MAKVNHGMDAKKFSRQESPAQADKRNPPVRLKFDGSNEDTSKKVTSTRIKTLPKGSIVTPSPATSQSISPDGITKRGGTIRFQF
jgi:hypothetical protein